MSKKDLSQLGLVQPLLIALVLVGVFGLYKLLNTIVVTRPSHTNSNVQGIFLAKGGDDSGSSGGSGDSGSSGSSSGGSSSSSGEGNSSSGGSSSGGSSSGSGSSGGGGSSSGGSRDSSSSKSGSSGSSNTFLKTPSPVIKQESKGELEVKVEKNEQPKLNDDLNENELEQELLESSISEIEFKEVDGQLELEAKDATGSSKKISPNKGPGNSEQRIETKINLGQLIGSASGSLLSKKKVELDVEGDKLVLRSEGVEAETDFPLSLDKTTGQLVVTTPNGVRPIRVLPDQASEIAKHAGVQNQIQKITLDPNDVASATDSAVFKLRGVRLGNLFGLIPVVANVESEIGAQSGSIVSIKQPMWLNILNSFVF